MRATAFPDEDASKLKTPADIMPLYLYLMGDDSRRKRGSASMHSPAVNLVQLNKRNVIIMSEDRHQQRQQRLKEKVDSRIAAAQEVRGILIVLPVTGKVKPQQLSEQSPARWAMALSGSHTVYQGGVAKR